VVPLRPRLELGLDLCHAQYRRPRLHHVKNSGSFADWDLMSPLNRDQMTPLTALVQGIYSLVFLSCILWTVSSTISPNNASNLPYFHILDVPRHTMSRLERISKYYMLRAIPSLVDSYKYSNRTSYGDA